MNKESPQDPSGFRGERLRHRRDQKRQRTVYGQFVRRYLAAALASLLAFAVISAIALRLWSISQEKPISKPRRWGSAT